MRAAIVALLLVSSPASAHCYSRWYYPTPQQGCPSSLAHRAAEQKRDWYVEITAPPSSWTLDAPKDSERDDAIERLKTELGKLR